jgi:dienelactone hydrolase
MRWILAYVLTFALAAGLTPAQAGSFEAVSFASAATPLGGLQLKRALERGEAPQPRPGDPITGFLMRPSGEGPFPAIVHLHGCEGLSPAFRANAGSGVTQEQGMEGVWARRFVQQGYAVLVVDSLTSRGIADVCSGAATAPRLADAYGALAYLAGLSVIDAQRVALVGFSHGGMTALSAVEKRESEPVVTGGRTFRAAVAFYPGCGSSGEVAAPTLILTGDSDTASDARACRQLVEDRSGAGSPLELEIYPGAQHAFDDETLTAPRMLFGHRLQHHPQAAEAAARKVQEFLQEVLQMAR